MVRVQVERLLEDKFKIRKEKHEYESTTNLTFS